MKIIAVILLLSVLPLASAAQTPLSPQQAEMKKLDFLVGQWQGEGWIMLGPGQRHTFRQTENVQRKVDGTVLLIEGVGKSKDPKNEGAIIHNAFAIITYDNSAKAFRWYAVRANADPVDTQLKVSEKTFIWGMTNQGGEIRFTIKINEKGQWFEVGEFSRDGKTWQKFFEMTLERVK